MEAAQNRKLWEIGQELEEVAEAILENEGELTPELEERLEAVEGAWEEKVERVALAVQTFSARAKMVKSEEDRLSTMRRAYDRTAGSLKDYLQVQMERAGRDKVEGPKARVRVQNNARPSISFTGDPNDLPEPFRKVEVRVNGTAAYEEWKTGGSLPDGFVVEQGRHLRIY